MKLAQHDNKLETNTQTTSTDFGIGDASVVIEILRNRLYEHKIRTLVQEYMCNGRDAQREIKQTKRLIVSVPNSLSPVFKVRDFGPGITPERIAKVFVLYGASTKRGTNGQTGGFGIGAKSAWSYTDSFTIVSITDGMKRTYVAHTGVNNQGRLDMLSEVETDEETGTEIQVAIKPHDATEFKNSILRASYFWKESERPEFRGMTQTDAQFHTEELRLGTTLEVTNKQLPNFLNLDYGDKALMVIDGVPYAVTQKLANKIKEVEKLVSTVKSMTIIHVGNGVVEVGANRESIADSEFTRESMSALAADMRKEFEGYCTKRFKAAKTNSEWILTYNELSKIAYVDSYSKFGSYRIERGAILSDTFAEVAIVSVTNNYRRSKTTISRDESRSIGLDNSSSVFFIDNKDESAVIQNKRIREWFECGKRGALILIDAKEVTGFDNTKLDAAGQPTKIVKVSLAQSKKTLAKIVADFNAKPLTSLPYTPTVRVPKEKRDRTKEEFTIHTARWGGKSPETITLAKIAGNGKKYLYVNFKDYDKFKDEMADMYGYLSEKNLIPCYLTEKSIDMAEGSSQFMRYQDWKSNFKVTKDLTAAVKTMNAKNAPVVAFLNKADTKIKDKFLVKMIEQYEGVSGRATIPETIQKIVLKDISSFIEDDKELTRHVKECYPLLSRIAHDSYANKADANEIVIYINAKV